MGKYADMLEEAKEEGTAKLLTPTFYQFSEVGDTVVGKYLDSLRVVNEKTQKEYNQYVFETDEGVIKFSLGNVTDKEIAPFLDRGKIYSFEFLGQHKIGGGKKVNKFKVLCLGNDTTQDIE
jgi:hypothetical protein